MRSTTPHMSFKLTLNPSSQLKLKKGEGIKIKTRNISTLSPLSSLPPNYSLTDSTVAFTPMTPKQPSHTQSLRSTAKAKVSLIPESNASLRRTKLKIHKIIAANPLSPCLSFNNKIDDYNTKVLNLLKSDYHQRRQVAYHRQFRFDRNDLGESHNRLETVMDYKPSVASYDPMQQIGQMLNDEEKKMVMLDTEYFFKESKGLGQWQQLKGRSLSETLQNEENPKEERGMSWTNARNRNNGSDRTYEANYTFNLPCASMKEEIKAKHKAIEADLRRFVNKERYFRLKEKRVEIKDFIGNDLAKMARRLNENVNKVYRKKERCTRKAMTEDEREEEMERAHNNSRSKLLMKNFLRLRTEAKEAANREMRRNRNARAPIAIRDYLAQIKANYLKRKPSQLKPTNARP